MNETTLFPSARNALLGVTVVKAFASFNQKLYFFKDKLFYAKANRTEMVAIWTQAIFWDIVMNAIM